jgi:2-C-methyl-D-erythritol 2,4-cyclodiphosphate synthase
MVMAEEPKIKPYMEKMVANLASALAVKPEDISIKAGTNEKLGFIGRGEGIAAQAVALIEKVDN